MCNKAMLLKYPHEDYVEFIVRAAVHLYIEHRIH